MKKVLLFLILVLFISISAVSASDNSTDSLVADCEDNVVCEDSDILQTNDVEVMEEDNSSDNVASGDENAAGDDVLQASSIDVVGDSNSSNEVLSEGNGSGNATPAKNKFQASNLVWYYAGNPVYKVKVVDSKGKGVSGEKVTIKLKGKSYNLKTDKNGIASLKINLKAGTYTVKVTYNKNTLTKKITLFPSRVTRAADLTSTYGTRVKYTIKVVGNDGKPCANARVKFIAGGKVYYKYTNSKGFANLHLNYNSGSYNLKYQVKGLFGKNTYSVKNKITFYILRWGWTGDVSRAPLIKQNMPNNEWVRKAVAATKEGIPLISISGGNGKSVFMTAGVHGNEVNPQVAAMKMIDYLTTHPIKGTVHIIPFVNVKAISQKLRLTNYDFNRAAHRSNTVSNNIINWVLKLKCDYYGDFHSTVSPGVPGINVVLGYKSPGSCIGLTNYIASNAKVNKIFYYPGEKYRWSLADWCNDRGTPAVICEVISPVNAVSSHATNLSYKQMSCFLRYAGVI